MEEVHLVMSERTRESYLDEIYTSLERYLLQYTPEIVTTKTFKLEIDNIDVLEFFINNSDFVIFNTRIKLEKLLLAYNIPISIDDISFLIDSTFFNHSRFRDLKGNSLFKVICVNAVVVGQGEIMAYLKKVFYQCPHCKSIEQVRVEEDQMDAIMCKSCKKHRKVIDSKCEYGEVKSLIIREDFEESGDKQPIEYLAKVKDEFIHKFDIGSKIKFIGIRKAVLQNKQTNYKIELDVLSGESLDDPKQISLNDDEVKSFKLQCKQPEFSEKIISSFSPDVYCKKDSVLWNVKTSFILFFLGGNKIDRKRQFVHLLLIGDPGLAKTTMMKYGISITPKSLYVAGNSSSKAGLTAIIEKQQDGKYIVKAGVLPLCDNGFAAVDEFNLMERDDQNGLQEAMENQSVTKAKAAYAQFPARVGIIGGANPIFGKYDKDKSVLENLGISVPLLSRFDLKWCLLDIVDKQKDSQITKHLLEYHKNSSKMNDDIPFDRKTLCRYLNYVRGLQPELTDAASEAIDKFIGKVRSLNDDQRAMPIDLRIIETTIRLSVARAKMLMKDFVEVSDVEFVTDLYLKSLESFGINTSGEIIQNKFFDRTELNKMDTFQKCFAECMDENQHIDKVDMITKLSTTKHFDEYRASEFFNKMYNIGKITELKNGKWRFV